MRTLAAIVCCLTLSFAQQPNRVIGAVTAKAADKLTVKTDAGASVEVAVTPETKVVRIPPGETSLAKATPITFADVNEGDRVLARTNQIIVMSKSDLDQKQAAERAEWQKRGAAGKVTALGDNSVTIKNTAGQSLTITTTQKTTFRRYAPDSVKFSDAKPSSYSELKIGDQVRVLGDRSGDAITAETLVSGEFHNIAGTITSIDPAAGIIKLTNLETKKPVTVKVNSDSVSRKLPPMMAQMMAARMNGTVSANPNPAAPASGAPPASGGAPGGPGGAPGRSGGFGGGGGPRDIGQMLERMPALSLSELKPGDAVIVASTVGTDASQATAITVLAGVEPLLTGPASDRRLSGPWTFDINIMP